jgi:hypothetical protein
MMSQKRRHPLRAAIHVVVGIAACALTAQAVAGSDVPAQQSKCEFWANKWAAEHPNVDPMDWPTDYFSTTSEIPPRPLLAYRDPSSGITFHVESDGRHLAAIDKNGKLIWNRNPFVDANACPYRSAHPYIAWIGPPGGYPEYAVIDPVKPMPDAKANASIVKELDSLPTRALRHLKRPKYGTRFIGLWFNSSQQGFVNIANGDFYYVGQN